MKLKLVKLIWCVEGKTYADMTLQCIECIFDPVEYSSYVISYLCCMVYLCWNMLLNEQTRIYGKLKYTFMSFLLNIVYHVFLKIFVVCNDEAAI